MTGALGKSQLPVIPEDSRLRPWREPLPSPESNHLFHSVSGSQGKVSQPPRLQASTVETPGPLRRGGRFLFQQQRLYISDCRCERPGKRTTYAERKTNQNSTSGSVLVTSCYVLASQGFHKGQTLSYRLQ